ncbi:CMRF35-like molecule 8 isoform X1 [Trichechus manatus latirostris]|uniref:CMRF35-like molecule 8 isoform X1 n=1 Tax=Trichechus manatus latirostris TaxID=127582 RepID=A0A2Y9QSP6_TRIMA|nr:CMRF35-like molecule 8 isoform X1 [Trichechus manatus latirostris]
MWERVNKAACEYALGGRKQCFGAKKSRSVSWKFGPPFLGRAETWCPAGAQAILGDACLQEMTQWDRAVWLPSALLLLWVPGCVTLSGPSTVTGVVGESLSVQCCYEEQFKENDKYWCREQLAPIGPCDKIVETSGSEREKTKGRVSIRDHPAQLSFTVTVKNLTVKDGGQYWCGISKRWWKDGVYSRDPTFQVVISVFPAPAPMSSTPTSTTTSTATTEGLPVLSMALATASTTHSPSSQENSNQSQSPGLSLLLSLLVVLLLLLVASLLVVWGMVRKRIKSAENAELSRNPSQSQLQPFEPSESCYVNLELQTCPSGKAPEPRPDMEVEYSTVAFPRAKLHHNSGTFVHHSQYSEITSTSPRRPQEETEYSVIKKT